MLGSGFRRPSFLEVRWSAVAAALFASKKLPTHRTNPTNDEMLLSYLERYALTQSLSQRVFSPTQLRTLAINGQTFFYETHEA